MYLRKRKCNYMALISDITRRRYPSGGIEDLTWILTVRSRRIWCLLPLTPSTIQRDLIDPIDLVDLVDPINLLQ
jgi:hypothetical protein